MLAYNDRDPAVRIHPMGTYHASMEADYPMAVSRSLNDRLATTASELQAQLRTPAAVQRLVEHGFRPRRGESTRPAALSDTSRFPDYPAPVPLSDADTWRSPADGWNWTPQWTR